jgi:DNA-binding transcriptional MerR regulator
MGVRTKQIISQTGGEIARQLGLTARRVQQLAQEGVLPKAGRGRYNLEDCRKAYDKYLQSQKDSSEIYKEERALRERIRREREELELALLKKRYLTRDEVAEEFVARIRILRDDLLNIPRMLPEGEEREIVDEEVIRILTEYSRPLPKKMRKVRGNS